jgi:hypothetical protein
MMWFADPLRSQFRAMIVLLCSINTAIADESFIISLDRLAVSCLPAGDWRYQFPAMSRDGRQLAVVVPTNEADDSYSLVLFHDAPKGLSKSLEMSLPYDRSFTGAECIASVESSELSMELISLEELDEINRLFETEQFRSLHPIDARDPEPSMLDALRRSTEEVVSWSKYFITYDYTGGRLTIQEIRSEPSELGLFDKEHELGRTYVDTQFRLESHAQAIDGSFECEGTPIPVGIWTNVADAGTLTRFLVQIKYLTPGQCQVPDEWLLFTAH